jgi:hypothetical protein
MQGEHCSHDEGFDDDVAAAADPERMLFVAARKGSKRTGLQKQGCMLVGP